jgi:hypothetical protein
MSESLAHQYVLSRDEAYDYTAALAADTPWSEMNPEQQASLIQEAYNQGWFEKGTTFIGKDGVDYTQQVQEAIDEMRAGRGAP